MKYLACGLAAALVFTAPNARAVTLILPPASVDMSVSAGGIDAYNNPFGSTAAQTGASFPPIGFLNYAVTTQAPGFAAGATGFASAGPQPYLSANASSAYSTVLLNTNGSPCGGNGCYSFGSTAMILNYTIAVVGPSSMATVPLDVFAIEKSTSAYNDNTTFAVLNLGGAGINAQYIAVNDAVTINTTYNVQVNSEISVQLRANAGAFAFPGQPGLLLNDAVQTFASAYVDPYFYIDPSFSQANQYQVLTSPGIGNSPTSSVPEPSTWAMMFVGFAGLGYAGYRRSKKSGAVLSAV